MKTSKLPSLLFLFLAIHSVVGNAQTTIYDIQYVAPGSGTDASPLLNQTVTISGIVTASVEADNLDVVFIQQPGLSEWAGIQLVYTAALADLKVGDAATITGVVVENAGRTLLDNITEVEVTGSGTIAPIFLDPNIFTSWNLAVNEKYEGMLIGLQNAPGFVSVVNANPDEPNNFGEWRVGSNPADADSGCRILTGRQTSQIASSLNVSYVNDLVWATNSGTMNVSPIVVENGNEFYAIIGLMTYYSGNMLLLPRNNEDVITEIPTAIEAPPLSVRSLQLYPNPTSRSATLAFDLAATDAYDVLLYTIQGELVQRVARWPHLQSGHHERQITFKDGLAPGHYELVIEGRNWKKAIRIAIQQ